MIEVEQAESLSNLIMLSAALFLSFEVGIMCSVSHDDLNEGTVRHMLYYRASSGIDEYEQSEPGKEMGNKGNVAAHFFLARCYLALTCHVLAICLGTGLNTTIVMATIWSRDFHAKNFQVFLKAGICLTFVAFTIGNLAFWFQLGAYVELVWPRYKNDDSYYDAQNQEMVEKPYSTNRGFIIEGIIEPFGVTGGAGMFFFSIVVPLVMVRISPSIGDATGVALCADENADDKSTNTSTAQSLPVTDLGQLLATQQRTNELLEKLIAAGQGETHAAISTFSDI